MPKYVQIAAFLLSLTLVFAYACGDSETTQNNANNASTCSTSDDCTGEEDGLVCQEGACVACDSSSDCVLDPRYATSQPICIDGACSECVDGRIGCACLGDETCNEGECVEGACTDCDRGEDGCVCRANGTCEVDFVCGDSSICEACTPGVESCPCDVGESCDTGLLCDGGTCVPDTCVDGDTGCPCDAGSCSAANAYCDGNDLCQACSSDVVGCPCEVDDTCLGDNYCVDDACTVCPDTEKPATCGCASSTECADGLVCDEDNMACRQAVACDLISCAPFQLCDASMGDAFCAEACEVGYSWDADTGTCIEVQVQACTDMAGNPTTEGQACIDQGKSCVVEDDLVYCVDTCDRLDCRLLSRECTPGAMLIDDAVCGACLPGYVETVDPMDPNSTICAPDADATCAANDPDSIAADCASKFQLCEENTMGARCGDCFSGRVLDPDTGACVEAGSCGGAICSANEFCLFPQDGSTPTCQARCASGEAFDEGTNSCVSCAGLTCAGGGIYGATVDGQCACSQDVFCAFNTDGSASRCQVSPCPAGEASIDGTSATCGACNITCGSKSVAGQGARVWPLRDRGGNCFCETLEGYYMAYGQNAQPRLCDADEDGWFNETAEQTWQDASAAPLDDAMLANFRCSRRQIDRVILQNEYGQRREMGVCGSDVLDWEPGQLPAACNGAPEVTGLFEPDILDADNLVIQNPNELPAYGMQTFSARSLNAMTKGCASLSADYNLNGREDILEIQPLKTADLTWVTNPTATDLLFAAASHFVELHTSHYEPRSGSVGSYVVAERRRCDDFGPTYEVGRDLYWEACYRKRRADFDLMGDRSGMDFAAQSCSAATGSCELPPADVFSTGQNLDGDTVVDHDVCALEAAGQLPLPDTPWLGMGHHSQFQCVQVSPSGAGHQLSRSRLRGGGSTNEFDANICNLAGSTPQSIPGAQPSVPDISCAYTPGTVQNVPDDAVTLVSANFTHRTTYSRGCINEALGTSFDVVPPSVETTRGFSRLCGGFVGSGVCVGSVCTTAVASSGNVGDFGKLICGCNENYSGSSCEVACTDNGLHVGGSDNNNLTVAERALYACTEVEPNASYYCREVPPDMSFAGGVRGAWLCGEFTQTMPTATSNPTLSGSVGSQNAELRGNVRSVNVVREPLTTTINGGTFTLY